jgi:hypothetical protein
MRGRQAIKSVTIAYDRHRITLDEYHRMIDNGVFASDARTELIEGYRRVTASLRNVEARREFVDAIA